MTISDEQLSAFLDSELPDAEMELIREALIDDENLANRLAEFAMVDEQLSSHYASIDKLVMPPAITLLLTQKPDAINNNVIQFPFWKKTQRNLQQYAAIAACTLLVIGFAVTQLLTDNNSADNWNAVANVLEQKTSGYEYDLNDGRHVKPQLTFINTNGNYCRQFQLTLADKSSDNIACRNNNQWKLVFNTKEKTVTSTDYQTASGNSQLDSKLDEIMQSDAFDIAAEQRAIDKGWIH